jgi:WD40 repeat protein
MRRLLDFEVAIDHHGDGYRTHVVASPAGEAHTDFALPFTDKDLEILVLKIIGSVGRVRRKVRRIESQERRLLEEFGGQLFQAAFSGSVRECLGLSRQVAESKGAGLRIRLRLPGALANVPWEYLYDKGHGFLGLSPGTALVRYVEMPKPARPFPISPPLRILAMISAPSDIVQLQGEEEWSKLNHALAALVNRGMVQVDRLEVGTLAALQRPLRLHEYHVLHFIGHGGWDEEAQDGALALEGPDLRARLVTGRDFWVMLEGYHSLRLVVLNACEGARSARDDPLGGVAQALVRLGVPAVIAMQFEISDPAALVFSQSFYEAIADFLPVDVAMVEARKTMFAQGNEVEWATPVLYLRSRDGRIFTRGEISDAARKAEEEAARKAEEEAARKAEEEAARKAEEEAKRRAQQEAARRARTVARRKAQQEAARKAEEEAARKAEEKAARKAADKAARKAEEEAARKARQDDERMAPEEAARRAEEEAKRRAQLEVPPRTLNVGDWVKAVAFSPDGTRLAIGSSMKVSLWNLRTGDNIWKRRIGLLKRSFVNAVAFSPDGTRLATGSSDPPYPARIWDAATGQQQLKLSHAPGARTSDGITSHGIWAVAFSPDGSRLATGSMDHTARIWDLTTGQRLLEISCGYWVEAVAFSPDGTRLATGCTDKCARVWDAASGRQLLEVRHGGYVHSVAFSPDGARLASGGEDDTARIWDATTGQQQLKLIHPSRVRTVAFSPDGTRLATGCMDNVARIWDATTGQQQLKLSHAPGARTLYGIWAVAFSPDGTRLATGSEVKSARIWDIAQSGITGK